MERLNQVISELEALGRSAADALRDGVSPPAPAEAAMGLVFRPGAQVMDLVSGQEGQVIAGTRANYVVPSPER